MKLLVLFAAIGFLSCGLSGAAVGAILAISALALIEFVCGMLDEL